MDKRIKQVYDDVVRQKINKPINKRMNMNKVQMEMIINTRHKMDKIQDGHSNKQYTSKQT